MLDNILNHGTDLLAWFNVLKVIVLLFIAYWLGKRVFVFCRNKEWEDVTKLKKGVKGILFRLAILIFAVLALYVFFGSGDVYNPMNQPESGTTTLQKEFQRRDTTTIESIREKSDKAIPDVLKRQNDASFKQEAEEADEYIKELLKKYPKN